MRKEGCKKIDISYIDDINIRGTGSRFICSCYIYIKCKRRKITMQFILSDAYMQRNTRNEIASNFR